MTIVLHAIQRCSSFVLAEVTCMFAHGVGSTQIYWQKGYATALIVFEVKPVNPPYSGKLIYSSRRRRRQFLSSIFDEDNNNHGPSYESWYPECRVQTPGVCTAGHNENGW